MFEIAFLLGIFSYVLLFLGFVGLLYQQVVIGCSILLFSIAVYVYKRKLTNIFRNINVFNFIGFIKGNSFFGLVMALLVLQVVVNVIGVLGPELGFDALWYHLTLPKLYLSYHWVLHIPGGLLYYSDMPKLTEMLYVSGLAFGTTVLPKFIHFTFGILTLVVIYQLAKKFVTPFFALLAVLVFYTNLVVGWESISAYVDLARTFFETLALLSFFTWLEQRDKKMLLYCAILVGLAIAVKLLAVGTLVLFLLLITGFLIHAHTKPFEILKVLLLFSLFSLLIPFPWFVFSYIHTGNPIYPFFTPVYPSGIKLQLLNPVYFLQTTWQLFTNSSDLLSPVYLALLPLIFPLWKHFTNEKKILGSYCLLGFLLWYSIPQTGGGRFIVPYLPAFSILAVVVIREQRKSLRQILVWFVVTVALVSIVYRGVANAKFLPVLLGNESASTFLTRHLNFSFGDFYDTDGYFAKHLKPSDKVLLFGFHNLYYVDFPFIDASWVRKGDTFDYIAVQAGPLPSRFKDWQLVYTNSTTHVALYSFGGVAWAW